MFTAVNSQEPESVPVRNWTPNYSGAHRDQHLLDVDSIIAS